MKKSAKPKSPTPCSNCLGLPQKKRNVSEIPIICDLTRPENSKDIYTSKHKRKPRLKRFYEGDSKNLQNKGNVHDGYFKLVNKAIHRKPIEDVAKSRHVYLFRCMRN